ncbi:MAG: alpha-E domain-containing protein [Betaproteobacteria bacterium]|nr:alpha-E domain-containing protein [Betaproteobacteria bacterium]
MLSRVAENLYWMTRYLERAENTARLINSTTQVLLDLPRGAAFGWDVLLKVAGLDGEAQERGIGLDETSLMRFLILDEANPSSILASIHSARENTRTFREVLPMEIWERINRLYLYIRANAEHATEGRSARYEVLNQVIELRQSIIGLLMGSMSHDIAYQFLKLGRNIERADMTTRIVDVNSAVLLPGDPVIAQPLMERLWMGTLNALSAYQMYRCHVGVHVRSKDVVNFLIKDPHYPRTVIHCLNEIEGCLSVLPNQMEAMRVTRQAWRRLESMKLDDLAPVVLHEYLDQVQTDLGAIHGAIARQYFHLYQTPPSIQAGSAGCGGQSEPHQTGGEG